MIALACVLATTKVILIPFTLSIFIVLVYSPLIHYLQTKFKLPRSIVLILSTVLITAIFFVVIIFIANSIDSFVQGADQYKDRINELVLKVNSLMQSFGYSFTETNAKLIAEKIPVASFIKNITGGVIGLMSNAFLVIIFTLFLITGESMHDASSTSSKLKVFEEIKNSAGKYVQTKLLTSGATSIFTYIVLLSFQVEMAFMFAILTFLLNFIPNIGSLIAVILPLPIILLQFGIGFQMILLVLLLVAIQVIIGNILEPKLMGESMGLHPVTILLSLTVWGFLWGIIGMFLSVPITATLKIIFSKFELTKPISNLFSGKFTD